MIYMCEISKIINYTLVILFCKHMGRKYAIKRAPLMVVEDFTKKNDIVCEN